jgi:hypothetical protein
MTSLLGKIMAQVLSVFALSTKEMRERRISGSFRSMSSFMSDYGVEKFMKRLVGKKDVEDALERLDMLTKEENLMTAARNLEATHLVHASIKATQGVTHRIDDKLTTIEQIVHDVDGNVRATKELTHDVHESVIAIKEDTRGVNENVKHGAHSFNVFIHVTDLFLSYIETGMDELQSWLQPHVSVNCCS